MARAPSVDKNGLRKGAWSEEEDHKLRAYVLRYGHWNWRQLPKFAGLSRCGKSCRLRWMNYLKPGIKRGNFSKDEDEMIIKLHKELGNKWSAIAEKLAGRSDNEIKNHWHSHLKKRLQTKQDYPKITRSSSSTETYHQYGLSDQVDDYQSSGIFQEAKIAEDQSEVSSCFSSNSSDQSCNTVFEEGMMATSSQPFEETFDCFWDDLLFADPSFSSSESRGFMIEEEFTLPYSLFGEDDVNFFNNFMQYNTFTAL